MLIRCVKPFRDLKAEGRPMRSVGEQWDASPERLRELTGGKYGTLAESVQKRPAADATGPQSIIPDLSAMTLRQLSELCDAEGVIVRGRRRKADLAAALMEHWETE